MSSTMMMERSSLGVPGYGVPGMSPTGYGSPTTAPVNWLTVPRCTIKAEKCQGGIKLSCQCTDKVACSMLQNLCQMLQGGMCSCCCIMNGMVCYSCNLCMGMCKVEMTKDGCCITCTSGDPKCCEMIQSCCDCISCCLKCGCTCCVMMNNTPVCCGIC